MTAETQIIRTQKGDKNFDLFSDFPKEIYPKLSPRFILGHDAVDAHLEACYVLLENGMVKGRLAFYENPKLFFKGEKAACIGSYECVDESNFSGILINYAKDLAKKKGYDYLIGPMEGSTWNNHRFSINDDKPPFFMEASHHRYYPKQFLKAGFSVISDYFSNQDEKLEVDLLQLQKFETHYLNKGAVFRNLNPNDLENEFKKIAKFSLDAFSDNFLFSPISLEDFIAKYKKIEPLIDPNLVWIVENATGEIEAFIFSVLDHFDKINGNKTLIIKSMARKRDSKFKGIGSYLAAKTIALAKEQGFKKIIHAFMIKDNASKLISEKYADAPFKTYALYGISLKTDKK